MNRRDFLKGSAALAVLGAAGGFAAGGLAAGTKKNEKRAEQVTRKQYKDTSLAPPLLGFGMMRLPEGNFGIDTRRAAAMVERAMASGLNYFDTAYMYHGGESEKFIGKVLSRYPRESWILTDKLPAYQLSGRPEMEKTFAEQLRRTKAGYFDFCFLHWLSDAHWKHAQEIGAYEFLKEKQKAGLIRHVGFSYHGDAADLKVIAESREWDLAQIQLNFRDWDTVGRNLYNVLTDCRIPIAVMGPLGGGTLASISPAAERILKEAAPASSVASWALRFIASLPNVQIVLSGMSTMEQLEDNIATFTDFKPLSDAERETLRRAMAAAGWRRSGTACCTACRYCLPCPAGLTIPDVFRIYNRFREDGDREKFRRAVSALPEGTRPGDCVNCGACLKKCPQKIAIPDHMKEIVRELR